MLKPPLEPGGGGVMGGQLQSKAHVNFQQVMRGFGVACKLPCAVANLKFHNNLQCQVLTKIPLFMQWWVGVHPPKRRKRFAFVGFIWMRLCTGTAFVRRCDVIGLQTSPLKDVAPELGHSHSLFTLLPSDTRSICCHTTRLQSSLILQAVIDSITAPFFNPLFKKLQRNWLLSFTFKRNSIWDPSWAETNSRS